jgi:hypothetical protein
MYDRLKHDASWDAALYVVALFSPVLKEEDKNVKFASVYKRLREAFDLYEIACGQLQKRLHPIKN